MSKRWFTLLLPVLLLAFCIGCSDSDDPVDQGQAMDPADQFIAMQTKAEIYINDDLDCPGGLSADLLSTDFSDYTVIDIRSASAFDAGHIEGAYHSSLATILSDVDSGAIPSNKDIIIACYTGQSAGHAKVALEMLYDDIEIKSLLWGMASWNQQLTGSWDSNTGDNLGDEHFPTIHFEETEEDALQIDLMLKGGGCENVGAQYSLPNSALGAGRDLAGVRKVTLDAVHKAQGKGCAPGILSVAIEGDRGSSFAASKETLLRQLDNTNSNPELADLEQRLTDESNQLGIGPMGFGGKTTVLGTKITTTHRLPASYFVSVSYMCWAYRRRRMVVDGDQITYQ